MFKLREYQELGLQRLNYFLQTGGQRAIIDIPTGTGKTPLGLGAAMRINRRTLWIANRDVLITQPYKKVLDIWPSVDRGIVKGPTDEPHAKDIVFASIQTIGLALESRGGKLTRLEACGPFGFVVIDECHHAVSESYIRVLEQLGCFTPGGPVVLGLTATPERADGIGLDKTFEQIVYSLGIREAVEKGYLAPILPPLIIQVPKFNLGKIPIIRGDFSLEALEAVMREVKAAEFIADTYCQYAQGRKTVIFTPRVRIAEMVAQSLRNKNVSSEYIEGEFDSERRDRVLEQFASGDIQVLSNSNLLTEGFDDQTITCVIVARPTLSRGMYLQMIGRGTRLCPDLPKKDLLIIDITGQNANDRLVTAQNVLNLRPNEGINHQPQAPTPPLHPLISMVRVKHTIRPITWKKIDKSYMAMSTLGAKVWIIPSGEKWDICTQVNGAFTKVDSLFDKGLSIDMGADLIRQLDVQGATA